MDYHRPEVQQRIRQLMALIFSLITCATVTIIQPLGHGKKDPEPYHTSALSGEAWVIELLVGHPDWIRCELGMDAFVFAKLIADLRAQGHGNSKWVSLEEQLSIFLYTCVTGLTIRHVGKQFQRSNATISQ